MPNYLYRCPKCGIELEEIHSVADRYKQLCSKCKIKMKIMIQPTSFHIFEPFDHPNLDKKPVHIKNRKHLQQEANRRGMRASY